MTDPDSLCRVLIVEDQKVARDSLARMIGRHSCYSVVGAAGTAEDAMPMVSQLKPNVVLLDLGLPGMSGIEAIRKFRDQSPQVEILILTIFDTDDAVFQSIKAGASGYLLKDSTPEEILEALDLLVSQKGAPMSPTIARRVLQELQKDRGTREATEGLTVREREILDLLAKGYAYKEVAEGLGIAFGTVQTHIKNIYQKLQVTTKIEAVTKVFGLAHRQ
ncbi:MAG: response regulator transcription factor [Nitrospirae bacterium]|nr:response regulator transcription factor [Nitrospirota bacterium]